ncbi:MAG: SIR2 family protein [Verrucomicrobia bacterium]|nr:SIR2 family protein [Verrucomicrobiota bacterium]
MSDLWDKVNQVVGTTGLDGMCQRVGYTRKGERGNIEHLLSRCLLHERLGTDAGTEIAAFRKNAEKTVVQTCRFLQPQQELQTHEEFLRRVARRPTNKPRTQVFTTNYDLCFEHAASRVGFAVIDGFSHTLPQRFDGDFFNLDYVRRPSGAEAPEFADKVFRLFKLHGSVDWERQETGEIVRKEQALEPVIIYPAESKFELSYQQPFIEVMARFQEAVREPNTGLFVVGFGFNDAHLVQPILSAIRGNAALKVLILTKDLRDACASGKNEALAKIATLTKEGDSRICMLDGRFEDIAPRIPDLLTATAGERQMEILRRVLDSVSA